VIAHGLVFLDDLHSFGTWISDLAPEWANERGLRGELLAPTALPPPVIVVVMRSLSWQLLEASAAWLAMARWVVMVVDARAEPPVPEGDAAMELHMRAKLAAELQQRVTFVELEPEGRAIVERKHGAEEARAPDPDLERAIDHALKLAARRATALAAEGPAWPTPVVRAPRRGAVAPGPWIPWSPPPTHDGILDEEDALRHLSAGLCWPASGPALLDAVAGARLELGSGERTPLPALAGVAGRWVPVAAHPDGARWLRRSGGERTSWSIDGSDAPGEAHPGGWGQVIGIEPGGQLAWSGGRCHFSWRVLSERGPALWTRSNHDWPCGHAKKLYGYEDNDPLYVQLSADGTTCLSVYEHDALITPGLPLRWREVAAAGDRGDRFVLAERMRGEPRALLFERSDDADVFPGDPYEAEEDARDRHAVVTLGPTAELRYAVGLEAPVYQLASGSVTRLNEVAGGAGGWGVFDEQHRLTRRGRGRLLAGWDRWLVIEEQAQLRREDLLTGEREPLGGVDRPIRFAHAFVGSPNALLVSLELDAQGRCAGGLVRLV
jgi:hypothetical protein